MSNSLIKWLEGLSSNMETAVRAYCELDGNCSVALTQIVLEQAYLHNCSEIVKSETRKMILNFYNEEEEIDVLAA